MTDEVLLQQLLRASATFNDVWRSTSEAAPASDPATLEDALDDLSTHIQRLLLKDRQHELEPLLGALEDVYVSATPAQRGLVRDCVFTALLESFEKAGVARHLLVARLGPHCRAAWAEIDGS